MSNNPQSIQSPCIGVCAMNESNGLCHGCYRTIEEIREWWDMAPEKRSQVMAQLEQRQTAGISFD